MTKIKEKKKTNENDVASVDFSKQYIPIYFNQRDELLLKKNKRETI